MSAPRPPSALTADVTAKVHVTAKAHVASLGAQPQAGLLEALPGWEALLAFPNNLGAARGPILVVDGVFDGARVFV